MEQVPSRSEVRRNRTRGGEESLGLCWRLEPLHPALSLTGGLMRVIQAILEKTMLAVFHTRSSLLRGCTIASELIRIDREQHLVQVPLVARPARPLPQLMRVCLPTLPAPIEHRLIGQNDASFDHHLFDITIAQAISQVEPDTIADDLCWEPMALIQVG
jgi:hypothetical protein